ncbi:EamA family transporter [Candidatus Dojkabacteria bacterium]|nr:EamA family transporter [Candidatus Dojkabacteria bacterium]
MKYKKAYTLLLINAFLWGISPAIIKFGTAELSTNAFLYYRFLIVGVFVIAYLFLSKKLIQALKLFKSPKTVITMVLINPANLYIMYLGLIKTTSSTGSIVSALTPLIAGLMGWMLLKETITRSEKLGTFLAFAGIILLIALQSSTPATVGLDFEDNALGVLLIVAGSTLYVIGNILFKTIPNKQKFLVSTTSFLTNIPFFGLILLVSEPSNLIPSFPSYRSLLSVGYMAIFGSLIAFTALQMALEDVEVSEANVFTYLQPLFGIPAAILFLGESFELIWLLPLGLIAIGILLNIKEKFYHASLS